MEIDEGSFVSESNEGLMESDVECIAEEAAILGIDLCRDQDHAEIRKAIEIDVKKAAKTNILVYPSLCRFFNSLYILSYHFSLYLLTMIVRIAYHLALMRQSDSSFHLIEEVEKVKKQYLLEWLASKGKLEYSSMWIESFFPKTAKLSSEFNSLRSQKADSYKREKYS